MEFPIEIQRLIHDFARPTTRVDWRRGSYINYNLADMPYFAIREQLEKLYPYYVSGIINYSNDDSQFKSYDIIIPNKLYKGCNYYKGGFF